MSPQSGYLIETFVTLAAVLAVSIVVLYFAKRLGVGRGSGPITLVGVLPLEPRRSIYLVRIGENVLVVGVSEAGMTRLGELPASALSEGGELPAPSFARILERLGGADKGENVGKGERLGGAS